VTFMNDAQLHALDHGYAYGWMWLSGVVILIGGSALFIGYTAQQVARIPVEQDRAASHSGASV
jgi:hypothetical protein